FSRIDQLKTVFPFRTQENKELFEVRLPAQGTLSQLGAPYVFEDLRAFSTRDLGFGLLRHSVYLLENNPLVDDAPRLNLDLVILGDEILGAKIRGVFPSTDKATESALKAHWGEHVDFKNWPVVEKEFAQPEVRKIADENISKQLGEERTIEIPENLKSDF